MVRGKAHGTEMKSPGGPLEGLESKLTAAFLSIWMSLSGKNRDRSDSRPDLKRIPAGRGRRL